VLAALVDQAHASSAATADKMSVAVENSPQFRGYLPLEYTGNEGPRPQSAGRLHRDAGRPIDSQCRSMGQPVPAACLPETAMLGYYAAMRRWPSGCCRHAMRSAAGFSFAARMSIRC